MEDIERLHLFFMENGLYYLLPISAVEKIIDGRHKIEDSPVINFSELMEDSPETKFEENTYVIEINGGTESYRLSVELIIGIREITPDRQISLEGPLLNAGNRFLKDAVWMEEEQVWAYSLDPFRLNERGAADSLCTETVHFSESERNQPQEAEFILIEHDGRELYAEKNKIAAIVPKSKIQRVPRVQPDILGISSYERHLIIYYSLKKQHTKVIRNYDCGIIIKNINGTLFGVLGNIIGEYKGTLKDLRSLIYGIWEKKSD